MKLSKNVVIIQFDESPKRTPEGELTAHGWQLYSDMEGVEDVAKALNVVVKAALSAMQDAVAAGADPRHSADHALDEIEMALEAHDEYGAFDTEPRGVAFELVAAEVQRLYGIELED